MKHIRRLGVALLTFVLGIALSPMQFHLESVACGWRSSGASYRSTYFIQVTRGYREFDSPEEADAAFNKKLSEAAEVFEVGPKVDKNGALIGRRAVTMYYFPEESRYLTRVFWTDGRTLWSISSGSAQHVREFEKRALAEE